MKSNVWKTGLWGQPCSAWNMRFLWACAVAGPLSVYASCRWNEFGCDLQLTHLNPQPHVGGVTYTCWRCHITIGSTWSLKSSARLVWRRRSPNWSGATLELSCSMRLLLYSVGGKWVTGESCLCVVMSRASRLPHQTCAWKSELCIALYMPALCAHTWTELSFLLLKPHVGGVLCNLASDILAGNRVLQMFLTLFLV